MKQRAVVFFICLLGLVGLESAQNRPVGGAYAAAPIPGQPAAPVTPTPTAPPGVARPPTPPAPGAKPEEQLRIVADPATNSLIIFGTAQEFQNVKNILKELDQVPRQVLLDVMVAEVTLTGNQSLGVDYEILARNPATIFGQKFGSAGALRSLVDLFPAGSAFGQGLSGVFGGKDIKAFVNALQSDSRVKFLASPNLLASDNRPARIQVGSEIPILTSQQVTATTTGVLVNNVQYRNTGVILTLIPQVNTQGLVNLQIKQEVSNVGLENFGATGSPSFNTRDAETSAVVIDGDTLVIGGIISDRKTIDRTGIPYLMDLPVVGRFFGTTSDATERTELIILITPRVIRNRDESHSITEEFKNKLSTIRNELEKMQRDRARDLEKLEKMKKQAAEPAEPTTPPAEPSGPPAAGPARPGAYFVPPASVFTPAPPLVESSVSHNVLPGPSYPEARLETVLATLEAAIDSTRSENPVVAAAGDVGAQPEKVAATRAPPPRSQSEKPVPAALKLAQVWAVQVASFADGKDADFLAKRLRDKGYDVRVIVADVGGKTWHRVQVGEFASQQQAVDLQKSLKSSEKLEQTFVGSR